MRLSRFGREGMERSVTVARPVAASGRVELRRPEVAEKYRFDARGIEQEFEITGPAPAGSPGSPLVLELKVAGPLVPEGTIQAGAIGFTTGNGQESLRYGSLKVTDADGGVLHSSLVLTQGGAQIRILDERAAYPLIVEAILTSPAWTSSFGSKVAGAGDVNGDGFGDVVVASFGTAYLYQGSALGLSVTATWTSPLGGFVAGAGDVNGDGYDDVLTSGPFFSDKPNLYYGSSAGLSTAPGWTPEDTPDQPQVDSIASAGDVNGDGFSDVIVGSSNGSTNPAVRVYLGGAGGPGTTPSWTIEQADPYTALGYSVASAGDVNGDGFDDVIVGEPLYSETVPFEVPVTGRARLYFGSAAGLEDQPSWVSQRRVQFGWLGSAVASAGDVNGDGYADLILGGINGFRGTEPGIVQVYLGSTSGPGADPALELTGDGFLTHLGTSVAGAGDVNGDGFADLLAGEPDYDLSETVESVGRAYLFSGAAGGPAGSPAWQVQGEHAFQGVGNSVAGAGDVNGDGFGDLLVGSFEGASLYLGAPGNHFPVAHGSATALIECTSSAGAEVPLDASGSIDADSTPGTSDDIVAYDWFESFALPAQTLIAAGRTASPVLPMGGHAITLRVTDRAGATATDTFSLIVADTKKPSVSMTLSRDQLWPPTHQMIPVHASVESQDACGATQVVLASITSNEADDAPGKADGSTLLDIQGVTLNTPDFDFLLRAERSDNGGGRIYSVTYKATDATGNLAWITRQVSVPVNRRDSTRGKKVRSNSRPQTRDGATR